jgi:hypothetical protein
MEGAGTPKTAIVRARAPSGGMACSMLWVDVMNRLRNAVVVTVVLLAAGVHAGSTIKAPMLDRTGAEQGSAKVNLAKGSVNVKATLAPLPATIDTGTEPFQATIYKAYLLSSTDAAVEIPLASVYPTSKSKATVKAALKGDLSLLGLDRVVIVAFSKDGLSSFDVLTGTLVVQ